MPHDDESLSAIYDTLALFPSDEYFESMIRDNGLERRDRELLLKTPILFRRTRWLDDILERYFFERVLNRHAPPGCTYFLEKQIINETARILFQEKLAQNWGQEDPLGKGHDPVDRAIQFIEANLFDKLNLDQIARVAGISEATLLRKFKAHLKLTPYEYVRNRRLDESLPLLKAGEHPVGDIALLVGYEDFSAFSKAFRLRFRKSPSSYLR